MKLEDQREGGENPQPDQPGLQHQQGNMPVTQQRLFLIQTMISERAEHQNRAERNVTRVVTGIYFRRHPMPGQGGIELLILFCIEHLHHLSFHLL